MVFWGRKYFHWKNVSTLYFLFSSPGRISAADVMERPRCSNPGRMKAKNISSVHASIAHENIFTMCNVANPSLSSHFKGLPCLLQGVLSQEIH